MREKISGVYLLRNKINQRTYVGRSRDILGRYSGHINQLIDGSHSNKYLLDDYKKFGISNFEFQVLEIVDNQHPNLNAHLTGLEEKYTLQYEAMYPVGYCMRVGNLQSSDVRLLEDRIICYDLRSNKVDHAESFGEAGAITGLTAGAVKKAITSSTHYGKHHLFFFEEEYIRLKNEVLEHLISKGKRYSNLASQGVIMDNEFELNEGGRRPYD